MAKLHLLKCWPEYFHKVESGDKTFEIRLNDRDYQPDDLLLLREWKPETRQYTGEMVLCRVGYMTQGGPVQAGYCVLAIKLLERKAGDTFELEPEDG